MSFMREEEGENLWEEDGEDLWEEEGENLWEEKDVRLTGCPGTGDGSLISIPGVALEIWMAEARVGGGRRPWWVSRIQLTSRNIYIYIYVYRY